MFKNNEKVNLFEFLFKLLNELKEGCESRFPCCFLTDFTKFFFWIHRI